MARGRAGRWRTGVLAGDGGEDGAEVAVGERAPGEQRLQQGVVPPRQRRHMLPLAWAWEVGTGDADRENTRTYSANSSSSACGKDFSFCGRGDFWAMEDSVGVSREAHGEERGRRQGTLCRCRKGPGEGRKRWAVHLEWAGLPAR